MRRDQRDALWFVLIYTVIGVMWITLSDSFMASLSPDVETLDHLQNLKGWFFIGVTSCLLYFLMRRYQHQQSQIQLVARKNQDLLRESQSIARLGSYVLDLETGVWESTEVLDELFGIECSYGRSIDGWIALIHPDDQKKMSEYLSNEVIGKGNRFDKKYRIIRKNDHAVRWVHGYGFLEFNSQGKAIEMHGTIQDITDVRAQELQLYQISYAMNRVNVSVFLVDEKGCFLYVNDEAVRSLGYSREELIGGMRVSDISTKLGPEEWDDHWLKIQGSGSISFESEQRTKHGKEILVEVNASYFEFEGQRFSIGLVRDITERKQIESELRIAATAFETQEGILISDTNNLILRVNNKFTEITGYTAREVIGKNPKLLSSGRQDRDFYKAMWESINSTGSWSGEIWNRKKNGEIYPESLTVTAVKDDQGAVTNYVATLSDITSRKNDEKQIVNLAYYDPLTGLPNRRLLHDRLAQGIATSVRTRRFGAILFIDLDYFKSVNDTLGHFIGDQLLQQMATRIQSCLREGDTLSRQGGDEFVVMLNDLSEHELEAANQTEVVGEKILASLRVPYELSGHQCHVTSSIGATLFGTQKHSIAEIMKQADIAMYQAKKDGRDSLRFFDPEMQESINARAALERDLREAIEKRQFELYYQVHTDSARTPLGAEALIRWHHPERGLVPPADFIPFAEETGLILQIDNWVREAACHQLKEWEGDIRTCNLILSINISAKQFNQADFVERVKDALNSHDIESSKLRFELTETMLVDNIEETIIKMNALKELGIAFSLDDFGIGYSSLKYLQRLPLAQLKIDQSFVNGIFSNENNQKIVQTIIRMALGLKLEVIAEGVETEQQLEFLGLRGCQKFQGYLLGKPLPIDQFEGTLNKVE